MEHWIAAVVASIVGVAMAVLVVAVSFKVAGPGPQYTFSNQPTVGTAASHLTRSAWASRSGGRQNWLKPAGLERRRSGADGRSSRTDASSEARDQGAAGMEQSHHDVGAMIPLTTEQYRRAALAICGRAQDVEGAALLLDALGLRAALRAVAIPA